MPAHSYPTGKDVFAAGVARLQELYEQGDTVVVTMSGGKDSTVCMELAAIAAKRAGRLPVNVIMRDEEIMFPGTFEYCERVANRKDIDFHWITANQPVLNVFNRTMPYVWVFDPMLEPDKWVRKPPSICYMIPEKHIDALVIKDRFPVPDGKRLMKVVGLRCQESPSRKIGLISSGGHITKPNKHGAHAVRPIYDWTDGHIWKAVKENGWDYNSAYNTMYRMGVSRSAMRIGPPLQTAAQIQTLQMASRAWPQWFDRVSERAPGVRSAAQFGRRSVEPIRRAGETWEECFWRECIDEAPEPWIAERSRAVMEKLVRAHLRTSTEPFPQIKPKRGCKNGSWRLLAKIMYNGNPFAVKAEGLIPPLEPDFFRPGSGTWGGNPGFT